MLKPLNKLEAKRLGTFKVSNGKVVVTDPCYKRGTWCHGILDNLANGEWLAIARYSHEGGWGTRVAELEIRLHEPEESGRRRCLPDRERGWINAAFEVGVDSGQAGFFAEEHYPQGDCGDYGDESSFYGKACAATDDHGAQGGTIDGFGVVSRSGYGDGGYTCQSYEEDGKIAAARIIFIDDFEEIEDDLE